MLQAIKDWFVQKYLEYRVSKHIASQKYLFDYKDGNWEEMISGPDTPQTNGIIDVFVDQMIHTGRPEKMIHIIRTRNNSGVVMGMTKDRKVESFFFEEGIYDFARAFVDICLWVKEA